MQTTLKPITNIHRWRLAAITLGSALAMSFATTAFAAAPNLNSNGNAIGTVGVAFSYQITANQSIPNGGWGATGLPPGLTVNATTGLISGTPTTVGTYNSVHLSGTNANGTGTKDVRFTIDAAPTAIATISPPAVYTGDIVTLDATASHTNPLGGTLSYTWQQIAPSTPNISLSPDNKAVIATFAAPAPPAGVESQAVTFQVKVTDDSVNGGAKNSQSPDTMTTVYALPTANAGGDAHVNEGTQVTLHGSGTGVGLTYTWTDPYGLLSDIHVQNPTFTAPSISHTGAAFTFTLVVTEHRPGLDPKASAPDQVTINVDDQNQVPTAYPSVVDDPNNIQPEGTVDESTNVTIYAFGIDPDFYDNPITRFTWTQVHDAMGTPLLPTDPHVTSDPGFDSTAQAPTFTAPAVANGLQQIDLFFCLTVSDGFVSSGPSYATIHVLNTNDPPIPALTVNGSSDNPVQVGAGTLVTLDGSTSTDPNNTLSDPNHDTLTYKWEQIPTTTVALTPAPGFSSSPVATFTAPAAGTTLTFQLTVSDGDFEVSKTVDVKVVENNHPPIAIAGPTQTVPEAGPAVLDGSDSYDPDSDELTFLWTQTAGPAVSNWMGATTSDPSFVAPTFGGLGGSVTFQLVVTDSHGASSAPSFVTVSVYPNRPPIPNAGNNQTIDERTGVANLNGSATDADNNVLTYLWEQVDKGGPTVDLTYPDANDPSKATFIAPEVPCGGGQVVMKLTVKDGYVDAFDYVTIAITNVNRPPTADVGSDQNVSELDPVTLNGSNSKDLDADAILGFTWTQTGGPAVMLSDASAAAPTFTAPTIGGGDPNGSVDLKFHLVVTDGCDGLAQTDTNVHVANIPHSPIASAAGPATANEGGSTVTLDGSGSYDPDSDTLTYVWTPPAGIALSDIHAQKPTFVTQWVSADTPLKFKLTVSDPYGASSCAYATVTVLNINTPPRLDNLRADVSMLWPPDHRLVPVHILGVGDPDQAPYNATITINSVTQDERTNGLGDGDTPIDAIINGDAVLLRAERSGTGDGRVYRVTFTASDPETIALGNSPSATIRVMVPKSKKTDVAIDSGQNYDSTH